ncbi:MAG: hypothetical protein RR253_06985 [Oscillospiraceae bacterium]
MYNPKTKEVFTPNTGKAANMDNLSLQERTADDILQERSRAGGEKTKDGKFEYEGGGKRSSTKYAPSQQRNKSGVQVSPAKYSKLWGY